MLSFILAAKSMMFIAVISGIISAYIVYAVTDSKYIGAVVGVLIAFVVCLVPYLPQQTCINCGAHMKFGENYCTECGTYQKSADMFGKITCESCRRKVDVNAKICPYCGEKIDRFHDYSNQNNT